MLLPTMTSLIVLAPAMPDQLINGLFFQLMNARGENQPTKLKD
jgi:hypothetical protein